MDTPPTPIVTEPLVRSLAEYAALPVPDERQGMVADYLQEVLALLAAIDEIDLAETPPDLSFDPRWD